MTRHAEASVVIDGTKVSAGTLDPIALLTQIPRERITAMQRMIARHANQMQYSSVDTSELPRDRYGPSASAPTREGDGGTRRRGVAELSIGHHRRAGGSEGEGGVGAGGGVGTKLRDAFDVSIAHAWARSLDPATVSGGKHMQRVVGGALERVS